MYGRRQAVHVSYQGSTGPEIFFSSILERTNQNRKCRRMNICFEAGMFMRFFDLIWR